MKWLLLLLLFCASLVCKAQSISGKWEGRYTPRVDMLEVARLVVDILITDDTVVSGSSHLYYPNDRYEHYTIVGSYDPKDSTIFFMEDKTIAVDLGFFGANCLGNYTMKLSVKDTVMRFDGRWKDNATGFLKCPSMKVYLEKKQPSKDSVSKKPKIADARLRRSGHIQKLIEIAADEKDSIRIELLDNAQIDNDVVSVYLDDSLVLNRQKLAAEPAVFYLSMGRSFNLCSIKMVAESMGSVPPCTALMIVSTRRNRYTLTLSSDFGNTGILQLFLRE